MKLKDILKQIENVQIDIGTSVPMICGGTVRDKYLKDLSKISDLDITTGDKSIHFLGEEVFKLFSKNYNIVRKIMDDGHSSIYMGNLKIDFSSNFVVDGIEKFLYNKNIQNPTPIQKEMFSRDFTCNSLLLDFDLKTIIDPTEEGLEDIDKKIIKTCLDPNTTLISNKNRVVRSIYLATKLDFDIDKSIIEYVSKNPQSVNISSRKSLIEKLDLSFGYDADKTVFYIEKMNLWNYIPITDKLYPYYMKKFKGQNVSK